MTFVKISDRFLDINVVATLLSEPVSTLDECVNKGLLETNEPMGIFDEKFQRVIRKVRDLTMRIDKEKASIDQFVNELDGFREEYSGQLQIF